MSNRNGSIRLQFSGHTRLTNLLYTVRSVTGLPGIDLGSAIADPTALDPGPLNLRPAYPGGTVTFCTVHHQFDSSRAALEIGGPLRCTLLARNCDPPTPQNWSVDRSLSFFAIK